MASRVRRCRLAAPVVVALWLVSTSSMADPTKDQCVDANAKAQDFRRSGKLSAAREQLRLCTSASCPSMVRDDCTKRLDELESAQATIAFEVKDTSGADVSAVTVTVDGQPFASTLDGTALPVDRGSHVFVFTVAGQPPVTRTFVLTPDGTALSVPSAAFQIEFQIASGSVAMPWDFCVTQLSFAP